MSCGTNAFHFSIKEGENLASMQCSVQGHHGQAYAHVHACCTLQQFISVYDIKP